MKMDRRTFIKGAVIAASTPGVVASGEAGQPSILHDLFHEHQRTLQADDVAWGVVFDVGELEPMNSMRMPAVQIGQLMVGKHADGNKMFKPIMAHTDDEIRAHFERLLNSFPGLGYIPDLDERVRDGYRHQLEAKLDELAALTREQERVKCECGFTKAIEDAEKTAGAVRSVERQILDYVPRSLEEAAAKASWILKAYQEERGYLYEDEAAALEAALASIGRAVA
jgi:hypothetical protein